MRINVYAEEITSEVKVVVKTAEDTGITFYGLRLFLASPELLHHTEADDDRSAITFWVPWMKEKGNDWRQIHDAIMALNYSLADAREMEDNAVTPDPT